MKQLSILLFILVFFGSCKKIILGEPEFNSAENNFETFWNDFDKHYGLFDVRGWDWDSTYLVYKPQITNQSSDQELWNVFKEMITYLDDSHIFIYNPENDDFFSSGSELDAIVETEFSLNLLKNNYLENVKELALTENEGESYISGKLVGKDIGYIYLSEIESDNEDFMDEILSDIGHHKAIILDIRNNSGGDDEIGEKIAGRFADDNYPVYTVQTRNGPNHSNFSEPVTYSTEVLGQENYKKPVVILTDRITVSAAETMLFHFKAFDLVTQIGDTTAGDFSDVGMRRFLPNGWQYQYSIMKYLTPNGESLDGIGHVPSVSVRNSITDIQSEEDKVIERAIQYLFEEYGIE